MITTFLFVLPIAVSNTKDNVIAKVIFVKGNVQSDCSGRIEQLKKGQTLKSGDQISISPSQKAIAVIAFGPGFKSKMKLSQGSWLQIDEEMIKTKENKDGVLTKAMVKAGSILINYSNKFKDKNKLEDHSKSSALGVRGTEFFTYVDNKERMSMTVESGVVNVSSKNALDNTKNSVDVEKGKGTIVAQDGTTPTPKKQDWSDKVNWQLDPEKGKLEHSGDLFSEIEKQYEKWNEDIAKQRKAFSKDLEDQRKKLWGN